MVASHMRIAISEHKGGARNWRGYIIGNGLGAGKRAMSLREATKTNCFFMEYFLNKGKMGEVQYS